MTEPPVDIARVLKDFTGVVPVFPLPSLVLFPDTIVPLLIFEDRYRAMVRDALAGEKLVAVALLKPGWETQYEGNPAFHERVCVGTIVSHELMPDGRYKLLLYGLFRADVVEEVGTAPYRQAKVTVCEDAVHISQLPDLDGASKLLLPWERWLSDAIQTGVARPSAGPLRRRSRAPSR